MELKQKIRPVTEEDRGLPYISYSKLSNFEHCPLSHKLKYIDRKFSHKSTLAMEIGTVLHKALEIKGQAILSGETVDYTELKSLVEKGCDEDGKHILGIEELRKKYFEEFYVVDNKSGMNYEEKMKIFYEKVLPTRLEDPSWKIVATEKQFEFVYDDRAIIHGFIDRVDCNESGELRIVDYKSSKAVFREEDMKTPMQHVIYDLACIYLYDKPATVHEYDFILIDTIQECCSKGYLKRGITKLDKLLNKMDEMTEADEFPPSPTPLCYWCAYHSDSPNADPQYSGECLYHSLWTPKNKTFNVLNYYGEEIKKERKLVF